VGETRSTFQRRRRTITGGLLVAWLGIAVLEWVVEPPPWVEAGLWVGIFLLALGVSLAALVEVRRVAKKVRARKVPPERLLVQQVNEVRVRAYVREETLRVLASGAGAGAGIVAIVRFDGLVEPLLFGVAFGILGNTLLGREDRAEQLAIAERGL
jgi:hypothetical protein